jgi:hypothetical protein
VPMRPAESRSRRTRCAWREGRKARPRIWGADRILDQPGLPGRRLRTVWAMGAAGE